MLKLQFNNSEQDPVWVVEKNFTIGSADDNHLVIDDASVSPQHARINSTRRAFSLKDLGSTQGTLVNGNTVTQSPIIYGDTLTIGDIELTLIDPANEKKAYEWSLVAYSTFLSGQEFPLHLEADKNITIGRGKRCDIAFPGTHLSKEHARIHGSPDGLHITDLDSDNGIFVNDIRTEQAVLRSGDRLRLDVYSFYVFGPEINTPRPSLEEEVIESEEESVTNDEQSLQQEKQWVTRPTSPGNRSETDDRSSTASAWGVIFGLVMVSLLIGLSVYVFL